KEALRLLTYTGIIKKIDDGVKGSRSLIGTRYEVNYGILLSQINNPTKNSRDIISRIQMDSFTEFGQNHSVYQDLLKDSFFVEDDKMLVDSINSILIKSISELDLTSWQKSKLINEAGLNNIKE